MPDQAAAPARPGSSRVPGLALIRGYRRRWLAKDVGAGLVLSALLIPQGLAYAELAGLPAITGLYSSILCLLGYAVFGPSRVLVLGPDSALGSMIAATLAPLLLADGDPARAVALASMLALMVGVVMVLAGVARLGFVADLISRPIQLGYLNGLALTITVGQLPKLFGFSVDADGVARELGAFWSGLVGGDANASAAVLGLTCLAGILLARRFAPRLPAVLVTVVLAAVTVNLFDLAERGVRTIGVLPAGFPPLTLPAVQWSDLPPLALGALAICVVALADTLSNASSFAARHGEQVDGSQEMVGIGAANIATGLFQGFPVSASASRTAVADQAGSRTQVTGMVGAVAITLFLVLTPGLMQNVPQAALAAIVVSAAASLVDLGGTRRLWHQRRMEFGLCVIAFTGVAVLGVLPGLLLAIALSILNVFRRVWWPYQAQLGRVVGVPGLHDTARYDGAEVLPGLVVLRFDAPLIFANARTFREAVQRLVADHPDLRWLVLAAEPVTDVDTTAADTLQDVVAWLGARDVRLVVAEMPTPVRAKLERYDLAGVIGPDHYAPTVESAVERYIVLTGAAWQPAGGGAPGTP